MSVTDELLRNAESYAASFDKGDLPAAPGKKVAVVACMDARLSPYAVLGLTEGDANVIRNAGGVVTDEEFAARLESETDVRPDWSAHAFDDLEESVRTQIRRIEESPFIPHKNVRGFVYEVETGTLREVDAGA